MGSKYTEAQKKATERYLEANTDLIRVRVPKGTKDAWKAEAEARGVSLTQFVISCVSSHIK